MTQSLALVALVVRDYDAAIAFYTRTLGFDLLEDSYQAEQDKRWVVVRPKGDGQTAILLARAATEHQEEFIGNQAGGRVFLFLQTDDFARDFELYSSRGVRFVRPPKQAPYGIVAVFEDLYGNLWDLVEFSPRA
jgi:catechol 2,3-dioxygenase-like lactoylglutathione lyase family enzyme